jgi:hypothetical protein
LSVCSEKIGNVAFAAAGSAAAATLAATVCLRRGALAIGRAGIATTWLLPGALPAGLGLGIALVLR